MGVCVPARWPRAASAETAAQLLGGRSESRLPRHRHPTARCPNGPPTANRPLTDSLSPLSPYRSNSVASWAAGLRSSARWLAVICCARPRRWAACSSCPRPRSPSSDLAAANGVVPTSDVGWWAARKVWGSSALLSDIADEQHCRKLRARKPPPHFTPPLGHAALRAANGNKQRDPRATWPRARPAALRPPTPWALPHGAYVPD